MGLEIANFIDELVTTNPVGVTDPKSQGDDHLRLIKSVLKGTFPGLAGSAFRLQTKSSNYPIVATDNMTMLLCTASLTLTLPVATSLGNKHMFFVMATGPSVTFTPTGTDTVNGLTSFSLSFNQAAVVFCDGVSAYHVLMLGGTGGSARTGDVKAAMRAAPEPGWIFARGTIGNATSGASTRANADCAALFTALWTDFADAQAPVSSGRGASAAADFAASKTIGVPDCSGRAIFGMEATQTRLTDAISGINGGVLGETGGDQRLHQHSHGVNDPTHAHSAPIGRIVANGSGPDAQNSYADSGSVTPVTFAAATGISIQNTGAGASQNVPPGIVLNYFVKL